MKTLNALFLRLLLSHLISLSLLVTMSCKDPVQEEFTRMDSVSKQEARPWQDVLDELFFDPSIIVQKNGSIQEAVNIARPGDAIYIEAGLYKEVVTIDKADIKLIGLDGADGEKVIIENPGGEVNSVTVRGKSSDVEIINIQYQKVTDYLPGLHHPILSQARKRNRYFTMTRDELIPGIAHYQFEVRLGKREYDVVRIHRVVREYQPYHPMHAQGEVFMVHGASQDFDDIFLTAGAIGNINAQTSSPVYLASNGIDVWGIDLAWTLVPEEANDFTFMKDWGVERDVDHTLAAMSLARLIRGLTGQGFSRLNLLGFSYGVAVTYAAAGRETQQHPILRDIKGIIPVEGFMKYDPADEAYRNSACVQAAGILAMINGGAYENRLGLNLAPFGNLAIAAPNDPSPIISGLNNFQAGLFAGAIPGANPPAPFWHFVGGDLNEHNISTRLLYTEPSRWFYLLTTLAPYMPQRTTYEYRACQCDEEEVSMDDYLDQMSVPILYLGAGGGFGTYGEYTTSLTASTDVTTYTGESAISGRSPH